MRRSANAGSSGLLGNSPQRASSKPPPYAAAASSSSTRLGCVRNHASAADAPFAARKALHALSRTPAFFSGRTFWLSSADTSKACAADVDPKASSGGVKPAVTMLGRSCLTSWAMLQ